MTPRIGSEEYRESVRKKITNVALHVFAQKGYRQATMSDVAKEMNVTKPTIYLYFKNKEQLLEAISEAQQAHLNERLRQWVKSGGLWNYKTMLEHRAKLSIQNGHLQSLWLEIISEVPRNAAVKKIVLKNLEARRKIIEEVIEDQRGRKLIHSSVDPRALSIALMIILIGHQVLETLMIDASELDKVMQELMKGLRTLNLSQNRAVGIPVK